MRDKYLHMFYCDEYRDSLLYQQQFYHLDKNVLDQEYMKWCIDFDIALHRGRPSEVGIHSVQESW